MPAPRRRSKDMTAIDARQAALLDEQERLRQRMEDLERLIADAPKVAREEEKRRREELLSRNPRAHTLETATLVDKRDTLYPLSRQPRRRSLKRERKEARIKFFVLLVVVAALAAWVAHVLWQ
jgi:hypothetical protein